MAMEQDESQTDTERAQERLDRAQQQADRDRERHVVNSRSQREIRQAERELRGAQQGEQEQQERDTNPATRDNAGVSSAESRLQRARDRVLNNPGSGAAQQALERAEERLRDRVRDAGQQYHRDRERIREIAENAERGYYIPPAQQRALDQWQERHPVREDDPPSNSQNPDPLRDLIQTQFEEDPTIFDRRRTELEQERVRVNQEVEEVRNALQLASRPYIRQQWRLGFGGCSAGRRSAGFSGGRSGSGP